MGGEVKVTDKIEDVAKERERGERERERERERDKKKKKKKKYKEKRRAISKEISFLILFDLKFHFKQRKLAYKYTSL